MSSSEDEGITRTKKPLSEARLKAIEKMKEGRKRQLELKKKEKEEEKIIKKETKKKIKAKVEEEMSSLSGAMGLQSLNTLTPDALNELRKKALSMEYSKEHPKDVEVKEVIEDKPTIKPPRRKLAPTEGAVAKEDSDNEDEEIVINTHNTNRRKKNKPKKRVIINNYYDDNEDDDESEEEVVNNYYTKKQMARKPTKKNVAPIKDREPEPELEDEYDYGNSQQQFYPMGGIVFR